MCILLSFVLFRNHLAVSHIELVFMVLSVLRKLGKDKNMYLFNDCPSVGGRIMCETAQLTTSSIIQNTKCIPYSYHVVLAFFHIDHTNKTLRAKQNGHIFTDEITDEISRLKSIAFWTKISLKFVLRVQMLIMSWHRIGDKPLSQLIPPYS